jgi:hypothetical protein
VIWLTWRQQRTETLVAALLLVLVAALLVPTGLHMASVYESEGIGACVADPGGGCRETLDAFVARWDRLLNVVGWLNLVPALIGALLAVPLVLEFERGTFRLAWTQSVTRDRWLAVRIALVVGAALAVSVLLTLLMTWWRGPLDEVNGRFSDGFDLEGLVPTAYTLFAVGLVLAIGVVLRRTAAAIGLALVLFIAARIAIAAWARPNYAEPIRESWAGAAPSPDLRGAWVYSQGGELRTVEGLPPDPGALSACVEDATRKTFDDACIDRLGLVQSTFATYQPADRFWLFQAIEAGIFTAAALALLGFTVWWIRRRIG